MKGMSALKMKPIANILPFPEPIGVTWGITVFRCRANETYIHRVINMVNAVN